MSSQVLSDPKFCLQLAEGYKTLSRSFQHEAGFDLVYVKEVG